MRLADIKSSSSADEHGKVVLEFRDGEVLEGDFLLGCDGFHSAARRLFVEADRQETHTGRVVATGFTSLGTSCACACACAGVLGPDGEAAVESTALFMGQRVSLLVTYFEPTKSRAFLGSMTSMAEPGGDRGDGRTLLGSEGDRLKQDVWKDTDVVQFRDWSSGSCGVKSGTCTQYTSSPGRHMETRPSITSWRCSTNSELHPPPAGKVFA